MASSAIRLRSRPVMEFSVSLPAVTCYRFPVTKMTCARIAEEFSLTATSFTFLHTALHEAMINAVVHGALGIQRHFSGKEALREYYAQIESRLNEPRYQQASIHIHVHGEPGSISLSVSDEGEGYKTSPPTKRTPGTFPAGLGLSLIRECCSDMRVSDGGRTLTMDFAVA